MERTTPGRKKRTLPLALSSALLLLNLLFFTPFHLYRLNLGEFSVSLLGILSTFVLPALVVFLLLGLTGLFLPKALFSRYLSVLCCLGVLTWLQANFLLWEYGMLEGRGIDWTKDTWRGWVDGALWVVCLVAALVLHKHVSKVAVLLSIALTASQVLPVFLTSFDKPEIWTNAANYRAELRPPLPIFHFSSTQNVIHVVFDAFPSYAFEEILNAQPDHYSDVLEGFTFFKENTGAFPTTMVSVPAFLSGELFANHMPVVDFLDDVLGGKTITNAAYGGGYEVDFVHDTRSFYGRKDAKYSNFYVIPVPYKQSPLVQERRNSALMLDLVLFRSTPHFVKKSVHNNQLWLFQRWSGEQPYERFKYFAHRAFFRELIDSMAVRRDQPVYKLMHLWQTHPPFIVDKNGDFTGEPLVVTLENAMAQYSVSLEQFVEFLKKLKALDVYDSSLIVFHSDHGQRAWELPNMRSAPDYALGRIASAAVPLMLIKPPNSKGALKTSTAPTSLTDLPATISSILNLDEQFSGTSMLEIPQSGNRERTFSDYHWRARYNNSDYLDWIQEYSIRGSVFDVASWEPGAIYRPGGTPDKATSRPDSRVGREALKTAAYALDVESGQLMAPDGSEVGITSSALVGQAELIRGGTDHVLIGGWAVDLEHGDVPQAIVIFGNGEFLAAGPTDRRCPSRECQRQVSESKAKYGNGNVAWAGFRFAFSPALFEGLDKSSIRVFAVAKSSVASELLYDTRHAL